MSVYLYSVVHHEISASHRVGPLPCRDPKVTARVPHGKEPQRVPLPLLCAFKRVKENSRYPKMITGLLSSVRNFRVVSPKGGQGFLTCPDPLVKSLNGDTSERKHRRLKNWAKPKCSSFY